MASGYLDTASSFIAGIGFSVVFAITSIVILMLCARKKKRDSITIIRYIRHDELEIGPGKTSRSSTNAEATLVEDKNEKRSSQHSATNENRILPDIPKTNGNGIKNKPGSSTPDPSAGASSVESSHRNSGSSPKKSTMRRLPALPPTQVDIKQAAETAKNSKEVDSTYEDVRDNENLAVSPQTETIGSGDSSLYAKVPEDLQKRDDEDTDLYAQVGAAASNEFNPASPSSEDAAERQSSSSDGDAGDDDNMDSETAVTYASVDKMKKTMSVKKRNRENTPSTSSSGAPPPPVPDRNFDDDEESVNESQDPLPPPPPPQSIPDNEPTREEINEENQENDPQRSEEHAGPAYDTVSVRESLAHQRLRQMVEDEQRNRYVNTSQGPDGPDLYSQIGEVNPEALYESVSAPGSADGSVGIAQRPESSEARREDGYSTISYAQTAANTQGSLPPTDAVPTPNRGNPDYEDIDPV